MKFHPTIPFHYALLICIILFQFSCAKDSDLFTDYIIEENLEDFSVIDLEDAILIPSDFNWNDIPEDYENAVWEITESFDLEGATITLPEGVTLYFNGGLLTNGTLTANETLIAPQSSSQILDTVSLSGTFENEYIMPYWFGAAMDGVTDDRDAFIKTLAYAESLGLKVLVDKDMFLDVEETGTKSIFLDDNTWIEGANEANIIINNLLSPAFFIALSEDVTIKDITFLYDQEYDASYFETTDNTKNQQQLEDYMTKNKNVTFLSTNPVWKGPSAFRAVFSLEASKNILFENVAFKAKGATANKFMQYVFKFKEQYTSNQSISSGNIEDAAIPTNITLKNIIIDGAIMGLQGNVENLTVDNLKSYRYSDLQNEDGSYLGAYIDGGYKFPPPHLFYLTTDSSFSGKYPNNIILLNVTDYGDYIGTTEVRPTISGYCNSLKLVDQIENITVDNYKTYRRDGLGDMGGITNGVFTNIYAESTIAIFDPSYSFPSLRFVGELTNVSFKNITIKDNSKTLELYPLDVVIGNYVTMDNVHVHVNELINTPHGPFGISGSNNEVVNSSLTIQNHLGKETYKALIYNNNETLDNGANNHYEIEVNGWRDISNDANGLPIRMLFQNSSNTNDNYAKVVDTNNDFTIEQKGEVKQDTWTRTEEVELGTGSSQILNINIPTNFYVKSVNLTTLEALEDGLEVYLSTNSSSNNSSSWVSEISTTLGSTSKTFSGNTAHTSGQLLYLVANGDFDNKGKVSVELVLGRTTNGN